METPVTATIHSTRHDDTGDVWTLDLYTHGPDGYELFATVGTSEDDGDSEDPADWVAAWAERVGYDVVQLGDPTTFEVTPAPPAKWTLEHRDDAGRFGLIAVERYTDGPTSALDLAEDVMIGEADGEYRITTYSTEGKLMDRAEVEVYSNGAKVAEI